MNKLTQFSHLFKNTTMSVTWNLSLGIFCCAPSVRRSASSTLWPASRSWICLSRGSGTRIYTALVEARMTFPKITHTHGSGLQRSRTATKVFFFLHTTNRLIWLILRSTRSKRVQLWEEMTTSVTFLLLYQLLLSVTGSSSSRFNWDSSALKST